MSFQTGVLPSVTFCNPHPLPFDCIRERAYVLMTALMLTEQCCVVSPSSSSSWVEKELTLSALATIGTGEGGW